MSAPIYRIDAETEEALKLHSRWLAGDPNGKRLDFSGGSNLEGAQLNEAKLFGADLTDCNLESADLRWADLRMADLTRAKLKGARMTGVAMGRTVGVEYTSEAYYDGRILLYVEQDMRWIRHDHSGTRNAD